MNRPGLNMRGARPVSRPPALRCRAAVAAPKPPMGGGRAVPRIPGSLPWLGLFGRADIFTLYKTVDSAMVSTGSRMIEMEILGTRSVYLRHPDDLNLILRDQARFPKSQEALATLEAWLGNGLVANTDIPNHAAVKEVLLPAFRAASVKGFVPAFAASAAEMADVLLAAAGTPYNVEPLCRRATLDVIGRTGFGFDFGAVAAAAAQVAGSSGAAGAAGGAASSSSAAMPRAASPLQLDGEDVDIIAVFDSILETAMWLIFQLPIPEILIPKFKEYRRSIAVVDGVIDKMLQEKRANGIRETDTDLLSFMLKAQQEGNVLMSDKQLRDELQTMILAGSDTTATTVAFALYELSRRPDVLARCRAEAEALLAGRDPAAVPAEEYQSRLPLLTAVANETLRLYPAATETGRIASQDEVIGGYAIPKGTVLLPSMFSLQRHEDFWPRPLEWLPERWLPGDAADLAPHADKAFMPFTVGPRSCIGRYFAQLELNVLLAVLLTRVSFAPAPGFQAESRANFTLSSKDGVMLVPSAV
ncbi:MAG: cytochrome P450 [Monoraphidium minutum]|nr:MAG: cytochrome P450 [Monoraphidium minutum]